MDAMTTAQGERVIPELTLGWRLRMARARTGLGTREFAERIGVSHGTITNAEGDKRAVRAITIKMWAMASGVDEQWLETGNGPHKGDGPNGGATARKVGGLATLTPSGQTSRAGSRPGYSDLGIASQDGQSWAA